MKLSTGAGLGLVCLKVLDRISMEETKLKVNIRMFWSCNNVQGMQILDAFGT